MEKLINYSIDVGGINFIEKISGGNQEFEIFYETREHEHYKIVFDLVWDLKYTIENGVLDRFYHYRKNSEWMSGKSNILIVENSEYIKYFEKQVSGTRPVDDLIHFVLVDSIDMVLDVLTNKEPKIEKIIP